MAVPGFSPIPTPGQWPVDPQEDLPMSKGRIWIDGCFDFSHHGHAGAMLQARRLGKELIVGVHSDQEISDNKGPTVMTLEERVSAVNACRWTTASVPYAPYVTSLPWISHYGCYYVAHGDDITSDGNGEDCYRFVKAAGRFLVFRRTPRISTTDLVGRMLLCTKDHFIKSLSRKLAGEEGPGDEGERLTLGNDMKKTIEEFATDATGLRPGSEVWNWAGFNDFLKGVNGYHRIRPLTKLVKGKSPKPGQRVVYVDGGFDLFSSGHIEFLRLVHKAEEEVGQAHGWYNESARDLRIKEYGEDYGPAYVVAGVHDDEMINRWKGLNYPIMNIFERGLCALQCRYIHCVIFSAPVIPTRAYLNALPYGTPDTVYHGPTSFMPVKEDAYASAKAMDIFKEIAAHEFQDVNAEEIVQRVLRARERYEERQRLKGVKSVIEADIQRAAEIA